MIRSHRLATVFAPVVGVLVWLAGAAPAIAQPAEVPGAARDLVVQTDKGAVRGFRDDGVERFLGIRYAAPPVGALRWQPPQPADPWPGVQSATEYGARCAALASTNGPRSEAEDCLFVNVERPTGTAATRRLPVYLFIHGGGLVNGSSNQAGGGKIVRLSNAIVVSINYRLSVFGFLGLPGFHHVGTGNYGLLDQRAALAWVQRNIAAFGGDPAAVTLGGESAGAVSVCAHLTAPGSAGLFAQAMMQSGACLSRTLAQTEADSTRIAAAAGCPAGAGVVACMRGRSTDQLLAVSDAFNFNPTFTSGTPTLPRPPADAVASGAFTRVPLVNGSNRDEGRTFAQGNIGWNKDQYVALIQAIFGAAAPQVLARYPWPADADRFTPAYLIGAVITDAGLAGGIGGCTNLRLEQTFAKYVPTFAYEFDARNGPGLVPIPGYVWGAGHAAELAYLFPSFDNGPPIAPTFDAGERQLSRDMIGYWTAFVFNGRPDAQGLANWPRFNAAGQIMSLRVAGRSTVISSDTYRAEHHCGFWDGLG